MGHDANLDYSDCTTYISLGTERFSPCGRLESTKFASPRFTISVVNSWILLKIIALENCFQVFYTNKTKTKIQKGDCVV